MVVVSSSYSGLKYLTIKMLFKMCFKCKVLPLPRRLSADFFLLPEQDNRPLKGFKIFQIFLMGQGDYEYQFVLTICFIS